MNSLNPKHSFKLFQAVVLNIQKIPIANSHLNITKGTRLVTKTRKYRRPEDLKDPYYYGVGPRQEVKSKLDSISARGFAKEQYPYTPPSDLDEQLLKICKKIFGSELSSSWKDQSLSEPVFKYKVLTKCIETFKRNIPNSFLHEIQTVGDVLEFYSIPIQGCSHYEALVRDSDKLPPNLHVMRETPRFNPTKDTFFDGITAFPGRKRLVYTKSGEKFEKVLQWPDI